MLKEISRNKALRSDMIYLTVCVFTFFILLFTIFCSDSVDDVNHNGVDYAIDDDSSTDLCTVIILTVDYDTDVATEITTDDKARLDNIEICGNSGDRTIASDSKPGEMVCFTIGHLDSGTYRIKLNWSGPEDGYKINFFEVREEST